MTPTDAEKRFVERLRMVRKARHLSAAKLANLSGVSGVAISRIELGRRGVSLGEALDLATALGVPLEDLTRPGVFIAYATITIEGDT